ncbi:MAG: hypothetical protein E6Q36_08430 [Chryseobacterium sp.]|nr:MAG: hypothetical protein E6Q36_08430 [Chryseobacterium sp.]
MSPGECVSTRSNIFKPLRSHLSDYKIHTQDGMENDRTEDAGGPTVISQSGRIFQDWIVVHNDKFIAGN